MVEAQPDTVQHSVSIIDRYQHSGVSCESPLKISLLIKTRNSLQSFVFFQQKLANPVPFHMVTVEPFDAVKLSWKRQGTYKTISD